jgi:hypothetical protein
MALPKQTLFETLKETWQAWRDIPSDEMKRELAEKTAGLARSQAQMEKGYHRSFLEAADARTGGTYEEIRTTRWGLDRMTERGRARLEELKQATSRTQIEEVLQKDSPYKIKPTPEQLQELDKLQRQWGREFDAAHRWDAALPYDDSPDLDSLGSRPAQPRLKDLLSKDDSGSSKPPGAQQQGSQQKGSDQQGSQLQGSQQQGSQQTTDVPPGTGGPSDEEIFKKLRPPEPRPAPDGSDSSGADATPSPGDPPPDLDLPVGQGQPQAPSSPNAGRAPSSDVTPDASAGAQDAFPHDAVTPREGTPVPPSPPSGLPPPQGGSPARPPSVDLGAPTAAPVAPGGAPVSGTPLVSGGPAFPITPLEAAGGAVTGAGLGAGVATATGAGIAKAIGLIVGGFVIGILVVGTAVLIKRALDSPADGSTTAQAGPQLPGGPGAPGQYAASGPMELRAFGTELIATVTVATNEVKVTFPAEGGPVDPSSTARLTIDDYPWGEFNYSIGQGLGESVIGGLGGFQDAPALEVPPEYANCLAVFTMNITLTGRYDATTKTMSGEAVNRIGLEVPSTCPPDTHLEGGAPPPPATGTWTATFDGSKLRGKIELFAGEFDLPFAATVP